MSQIPADLIPMLVVGSCYENKQRIAGEGLERLPFRINGSVTTSRDEAGNWFYFQSTGGKRFKIRHLELARALFLHNSQLTRTAFRPDGLSGLASIEEGDGITRIIFHRLSDYPITHLNNTSSLWHLAWLLLDETARRSFGSIFSSWTQSVDDIWLFAFTPPNLDGWHGGVWGQYQVDDLGKIFVIHEFSDITSPYFELSSKVLIEHPRRKEPISINPAGCTRPKAPPIDPDPCLDLMAQPKLGKPLDSQRDCRFRFGFDHALEISLEKGIKVNSVSPTAKQDDECQKETAGVGHAEKEGTAYELDYAINNQSENAPPPELINAEPTAKFLVFRAVIEALQIEQDFEPGTISCHQLPPPRGGRQGALRTVSGEPVVYYLATMYYRKLPLILIEVDTDSMKGNHTMTTLIMGFHDDPDWGVREVMQSCSDEGVKWNKDYIKEISNFSVYCSHPKRFTTSSGNQHIRTPDEFRNAWEEILSNKIHQLYEQNVRTLA